MKFNQFKWWINLKKTPGTKWCQKAKFCQNASDWLCKALDCSDYDPQRNFIKIKKK